MSTVIYLENGLCPQHRRVEQHSGSIAELAPNWLLPYVAFVDGHPVLRADWELVLEDEQTLAFIDVDAIPQGGGGGSDPLRIVLMLAVMYFTAGMGVALVGAEFGALAGMGMSAGFVQGAITFAGMALINVIAPPPKLPSTQQAAALAAPSPTYSLQAQGNSARLEAAIPEHFGRHICYPDFAAQPYAEYAGNEQYLYQLLCIGRGSYDLEEIRIEDTPISSFGEVTTEVIPPYGQVTLFPSNVTASLEVAGQTLSTTPTGPFVANASGTLAHKLAIDLMLPKGIYYATDNGGLEVRAVHMLIEYAFVDDFGNLASGWNVLDADAAVSGASTTPFRWSHTYDVAPGRYTVRIKRTDVESTNTREANSVAWIGLRAYYPDPVGKHYGDCTLLAVKMRASNNLSAQASRKINVIATRKLPVWNGSIWSSPTATRNPAWAFAYAAKQVGQTDATLDLPALLTLANGCTARGDTFDARFDNFLSFWEAASKIAQSVRAKPYMQGGIIRVVRDQAATLPVALFSQRNIVKGSFSINYLMPTEDTADSVDVGYFDDITWAPAKVRATLASSTSAKPAKIDIFGVTSRAQAWREGLYQAACNKYRRKIISFQTEMEGFIPSFGDLIAIQHDMPAWGQGGEVSACLSSSNLTTYSEQFDGKAVSNVTCQSNSGIAPNGSMTADTLTITSLSDPYTTSMAYPTGAHVQSVFVKQGGAAPSSRAVLRPIIFATTLIDYYMSWDFATKTFSGSSGIHTGRGYIDCGNGWYRLWVAFPDQAGQSSTDTRVIPGPDAVGSTMLAWGVQVTNGTTLQDYVPTTSAAVPVATVLTLSEPPTWGVGTHYIGLRKRDGAVDGPYVVTAGGSTNQVILATPPAITPYTGQAEERTHYAFGPGITWRQPARVLSARPQSLHIVDIEAVNEDASVHTADTGLTLPAQVFSQLAGYTNAPAVAWVEASFLFNYPNMATVSWQPTPWAVNYEVQSSTDGVTWTHCGSTSANSLTFTAIYGKTTQVRVAASNLSRGPWMQTTVQIVLPFDPTGLAYTQEVSGIRIKWHERLEINFYELRVGGSNWDTATLVAPVTGTEYLWAAQVAGSYTLRLKAIDVNGNYSANAIALTAVIAGPGAPKVTYAVSGPDEVLSWSIPTSGFTVDRYEIRQGASWASADPVDTTKATSHRRKVDYAAGRTYWVAAVDVVGNYGAPDSVSAYITIPGVVTGARVEVIDNNVLLFWSPPLSGTLPVDRYEVRKGASWAAGAVVGSNGNSTFAAVFEQSGGTYTYWVAAVDSAGNAGTAASVVAAVNQPPDYILRNDFNSAFGGAKINALPFDGGLLLPVNTTETWAQHFANNGYATPQAQISAGNPLYIEPSLSTASYTEAIDYGTTLPATVITVTLNSTAVAGTVAGSCQIKYSNTSASGPWTSAPVGATSTLATNFRWVQVIYTFSGAAGQHLLKINALNIKLSVKNRTDSGSATVTNAAAGVVVPFGYAFIDADLPIVQPAGAVPLIPVVDYTDTPNPTQFTVYLYTTAGVKTTGSFSWTVRGF